MAFKNQMDALFIAVILCLCRSGIAQQISCTKALKPEPVKADLKEGLIYKDKNAIMCSDGECVKFSLNSIKNAYPEAFSSQDVAVKNTNLQFNEYVEKIPSKCASTKQAVDRFISQICPRFWSDHDRCCPTWRYVTYLRGPLTNISRRRCYILQIPYFRLYQYVAVGFCGWPRTCRICRQQYTVQSLLAWCPGDWGIKMHHFKIPTYCSCQGKLVEKHET